MSIPAPDAWIVPDPELEWAQLDADAKRERLLCAAGRVFSRDGLDAPMPAVATEAGAGVASVYRQFPSKHELLAAVVIRRLEQIQEAAGAAAATEGDRWTALTEMLWTIDQHRYTEAQWVSSAASADNRSRAAAGPPGHPHPENFAENNVYFGPALMLREIKLQVGDTEFFAMARDWVQTQRNQPVDRAAFTAFVNHHTGKDLTALIDKWLDSPTTPTPTPVR